MPVDTTANNVQDDFDNLSDDNLSMITILSIDNISEIDDTCYDDDKCTGIYGEDSGLRIPSKGIFR